MKKQFALLFCLAALVALALPAQAIYISNCPQLCTPTCPCSLQCLGPFGNTTCGAAGQTCTPLTEAPEDPIFLSFEQRLAQLDTAEEASNTGMETVSTGADDEPTEGTEQTGPSDEQTAESK